MKIRSINPPDNYIMFVGWTIETIVAPSYLLGFVAVFYEHATRPGVFWWNWE